MSRGVLLEAVPVRTAAPKARRDPWPFVDWTVFVVLGWLWRSWFAAVLAAGIFTGLFLLDPTPSTTAGATLLVMNYVAAVMVFGWLTRRMRAITLRRWWIAAGPKPGEYFSNVLDTFGPDGPVRRPRWFVQERVRRHLGEPAPNGRSAGPLRILGRLLRVPWHSAWRNFVVGLKGVFGTSLVMAPALLVMFTAWEYGWLNSFTKGYEQRAASATITLALGFPLFIVTMFYVPMAQAHFAATGEVRSFFDFGLVFRVTRARLWYMILLVGFTGLASLPLDLLKTTPQFLPQGNPWYDSASREDLLRWVWGYQWWSGLYLFLVLVALRWMVARTYASGVLALFRRGELSLDQLPAALRRDFERLGLSPVPTLPSNEWSATVWGAGKWMWRGFAYTVIGVVWLLFAVRVYVGEFINYHPVIGFLNHPLMQVPCVDTIPLHLYEEGSYNAEPSVTLD